MCLACLDDDNNESATRREFLAGALGLTAVSALATSTAIHAAGFLDIEGKSLVVDNEGTLLPAYTATPIGSDKRTTVVILHDRPGISKEMQELAREVARIGFVTLVIDCATRGSANVSVHPDALWSEAFSRDVQSDVRAGIVTLNGAPDANPIVILGFGAAGYTALRMALNDPLSVAGVIAFYTPIEEAKKSGTDPRPDLITLLARLNVPVQFHAGSADAAIDREQLNWLGRFVAVEPERRELYVYGGADSGFYSPSSPHYDKGYQMLARKRWQEFLTERFH